MKLDFFVCKILKIKTIKWKIYKNVIVIDAKKNIRKKDAKKIKKKLQIMKSKYNLN